MGGSDGRMVEECSGSCCTIHPSEMEECEGGKGDNSSGADCCESGLYEARDGGAEERRSGMEEGMMEYLEVEGSRSGGMGWNHLQESALHHLAEVAEKKKLQVRLYHRINTIKKSTS